MATFDVSTSSNFDATHDLILDEPYTEVEEFCTPDSLNASADYLNTLLTSYGYPVPLLFESDAIEDKCKIVNCIYNLMNDRKKDEQEKQEYRRMIDDMKRHQQVLEQKLNDGHHELKSSQNHEKELEGKLNASEAKAKKQSLEIARSKEEVTKIKHNIQYLRTQYEHETRRHEQELTKTQERLLKLMHDHYKVNVAYLHVNQTALEETELNENEHNQQLRETYTQLLEDASQREQDARQEALDLRKALLELYTELRRFLEQKIQQSNDSAEGRVEAHSKTIKNVYQETAKFRLPMDCGGQEAIRQIHDLLGRLGEEWQLQLEQKPTIYTEADMREKIDQIEVLEQTIQELLETVDSMKVEYEEKTNIYRRFEQGGFFDTLYPTALNLGYNADDASDSEDSIVDLEPMIEIKQRNLVEQRKRDQHKITEAALKLAQERERLEAERWAFTEMKRELQMHEVLHELNTTSESSNNNSSSTSIKPAVATQQSPSANTPSLAPARRSVAIAGLDANRSRKRRRSFFGVPSKR